MPDPLAAWLALDWEDVERSYNPDLQRFLSKLLGYPLRHVKVDARGSGGLPDIQLLNPDGEVWVVGDLKKDDTYLANPDWRRRFWEEKKKYVSGLVRYVLFITPHYLTVLDPQGEPVLSEEVVDLRQETTESLREKLDFLTYARATHERLWSDLTAGKLPYSYLKLDGEGIKRLKEDLFQGFNVLLKAAQRAFDDLEERYKQYLARRDELKTNEAFSEDAYRRALSRLDIEHRAVRKLFEETLPQFAEQYGRDLGKDKGALDPRIREAFLIDSTAALIARVLFIRLLEDLGLTGKRRLTNGGPLRWAELVEHLAGSATALLKLSSEDLSRLYREPFIEGFFDWILETNGALDRALQKLILRLNAYDFSGLSEEILGDIYQNFLPPAKRKKLGEFYTPASVVDYILKETALKDPGPILDPASGSGSFLVRYVHARLEDARKRGLDPEDTRREIQKEVWGFDLNPFASYITLFQLMWALLRFHPSGEPPKIHVYTLNSILKDPPIILDSGLAHEGEKARDTKQWRYVVGNPPYIRAERVKYGDEIKRLWGEVWGQNADTGLIFLYRAMREWLESGGKLGFVVSGGYAASDAAAPVWRLLHPGGELALRKLVWLEFVPKVWDAARVPLILIVEKTPPKDEDEIEVWVPRDWPDEPHEDTVSRIPYKAFFDPRVSPVSQKKQTPNLLPQRPQYGDYLLPLLKPKDTPLLQHLDPGTVGSITQALIPQTSRNNQTFWWTYGIQRGGVAVTEEPEGNEPVQVYSGRTLAVAHPGEPIGWVDLAAVRKRPYGKLSLWGRDDVEHPSQLLVLPKISRALSAVLLREMHEKTATLDTTLIAVPKPELSEALAGYLNSVLIRWFFAVRLRSAVVEGHYSTLYPRTLEALPWPRNPDAEALERLKEAYFTLEKAAAVSRQSPEEWLREVVTALDPSAGAPLRRIPELNFSTWEDDPDPSTIERHGRKLSGGLFATLELPDEDLAELVLVLVQGLDKERLSSRDLQRLVVPQDYTSLMRQYRALQQTFQTARVAFFRALEEVDEATFDLFKLAPADREHIQSRLASFPLNQLKPRYPWEVAKPRPLKAYTEDRWG